MSRFTGAEKIGAVVAAAVIFTIGGFALKNEKKPRPVASQIVGAKATELAAQISGIPVTAAEVETVKKDARKLFHGRPEGVVRIDKTSGQPYRITEQHDAQVMRVIATPDGSTYRFNVNEGVTASRQPNPDHVEDVFADAYNPPNDRHSSSFSGYILSLDTQDIKMVGVSPGAPSNGYYNTSNADSLAGEVLTADIFNMVGDKMQAVVTAAANNAPVPHFDAG